MIVPILIGVVSLFVLVAAFLGAKYWHWAHVTVLVLFYFAGVGYVMLAAQSLDIRTKFQRQEDRALTDLAKQSEGIEALINGTNDVRLIGRLASEGARIADDTDTMQGIRGLRQELDVHNHERGRVWRGVGPTAPADDQTGNVTAFFPALQATSTDEAASDEEADETVVAPLALRGDSVVYLFEQGSHDGDARQYLGEFRVTEVTGRQATLSPLNQWQIDPVAADRFFASQGPWIVYESMPIDKYDLFAGLDEERLRALLPEDSVGEYLRDGTAAEPDDDPFRLEGLDADGTPVLPDDAEGAASFRYRRLLRDYAFLLKDYDKAYAELVALVQATTTDLEKLESALQGAQLLGEHREQEIVQLNQDLIAAKKDRRVIEEHLNKLRSQQEKAQWLLQQTLDENARLVVARDRSQGQLSPVATGALDIDAL